MKAHIVAHHGAIEDVECGKQRGSAVPPVVDLDARSFVLGLANFMSPGGDKQPVLDPVQNGDFRTPRLGVDIEWVGVPSGAKVLPDGRALSTLDGKLSVAGRLALDPRGAKFWCRAGRAVFGNHRCILSVSRRASLLVISVDFLRSSSPVLVRWPEVKTSYLALTLAMEGADGSLEDFDCRCAGLQFRASGTADSLNLSWKKSGGKLTIRGGGLVQAGGEHNKSCIDVLDRAPIPIVRLSTEKII